MSNATNKLEKVCSVDDKTFCTHGDQRNKSSPSKEHARIEELEKIKQKIKLRVEQKEKELDELRKMSSSADAALKLNKDTFSKMNKLMWKKKKSVEQQGWSLYHSAQTGLKVHLDFINQDIKDTKGQMALRESILKTEDAYEFLIKSNAPFEMTKDLKKRPTFYHWLPFRKFVLDKTQLPMSVSALSAFYGEQPDYLKFDIYSWEVVSQSISWDPNTAHRNIELDSKSNGSQWAIFKSQPRGYPDHPDRFTDCVQVLSKEPLKKRSYFEVCPRGDCYIGVTYKSIERKGKSGQSVLGLNDKSWACFGGGFVPQSTKNGTWLLVMNMLRPHTVSVVLDQRQGILRFYQGSLGGPDMSLIYEVEQKFTKPLYFGAVFVTPGDHVIIPKVEAGRDVIFIPTGPYLF